MHKSGTWLTLVFLYLIPLIPLNSQAEATDTTCQILFNLNMTKAIQDGLFHPDSDLVYVDFEGTLSDIRLLPGVNRIYSGLAEEGLDTGLVYPFRFRINDSITETIAREVTANPGINSVNAWWNDEYLNFTTFMIDASGIPFYTFTPGEDDLLIEGDMNGWSETLLNRQGTSKIYEVSFPLDPSLTYEYRFLIRSDSTVTYEYLNGMNRLFRPPDTLITVQQYFNNRDTGKIALTLQCFMSIQQQLGNFDPATDYLDVAGTFNDWGSWDLLYDYYHSGLYQAVLLFDKTLIGGSPLEFKFRINGSWETAELEGQNPRTYTLLPYDTTFNPNTFSAWYDNEGPVVISPPWVTDVTIQGLLEVKQVLSGAYQYHNLSGIPEGQSVYQWYRADSPLSVPVPIDSATTINYVTDSVADLGKYLVFEVTPVAAYGDSATGLPVQVFTTGPIGNVGIGELTDQSIKLFPVPSRHTLYLDSKIPVRQYELIQASGLRIGNPAEPNASSFQIDISALPPGLYFIRTISIDGAPFITRFIKQ